MSIVPEKVQIGEVAVDGNEIPFLLRFATAHWRMSRLRSFPLAVARSLTTKRFRFEQTSLGRSASRFQREGELERSGVLSG